MLSFDVRDNVICDNHDFSVTLFCTSQLFLLFMNEKWFIIYDIILVKSSLLFAVFLHLTSINQSTNR